MVNATALLDTLRATLTRHPPPGVEGGDILGFFERHGPALEALIDGALRERRGEEGAWETREAEDPGHPEILLARLIDAYPDPIEARRFLVGQLASLRTLRGLRGAFEPTAEVDDALLTLAELAVAPALEAERGYHPDLVEYLLGDGDGRVPQVVEWMMAEGQRQAREGRPSWAVFRDYLGDPAPAQEALHALLATLQDDPNLAQARAANPDGPFKLALDKPTDDALLALYGRFPDVAAHALNHPELKDAFVDWLVGAWSRDAVSPGAAPPEEVRSSEATPTTDAPGEPTPWGGRRGDALEPEGVEKGQRVVLRGGEHGRVLRRWGYTRGGQWMYRGQGLQQVAPPGKDWIFEVQLDSGRRASSITALWAELAGPTRVIPDVQDALGIFLSPSEVWDGVAEAWGEIAHHEGKAQRAKRAASREEWETRAEGARRTLADRFGRLKAWRGAWPEGEISGLDPRLYRLIELEQGRPAPGTPEAVELSQVQRAPEAWRGQWTVGDGIRHFRAGEGKVGAAPAHRGRIAAIAGDRATLESGEDVPLWLLHPDLSAPVAAESLEGDRYAMDLAAEMLAEGAGNGGYPRRGAIAKAVKAYLIERGLAVKTRVNRGSMVTSISLGPAHGGPWSGEERTLLGALLPGLSILTDALHFDAWARAPETEHPSQDYGRRGGGVKIPAEHVGRFAALLAREMKAAGQSLSPLGERRLLSLAGDGTGGEPVGGDGARGAAEVGAAGGASEGGCFELSFELPGYGRVKVVCGQKGRRAVWHNVWAAGVRYGWNGQRWAKGMHPPEEVLAAVKARGVGVFG